MRQGDVACRYGGEAFVLVLPGTAVAEAVDVGERALQSIQRLEIVYRNQSLGRVTASFGIAVYPRARRTPAELIEAADQMLYSAKNAGRNRVESSGKTYPRNPKARP